MIIKLFHENAINKLNSNFIYIGQNDYKYLIVGIGINIINSPNLLNKQNNACEIILNVSEDVYQIEFEDNIIYYDKIKMDHYNANSNQFFRYKPDRVIVSFIEKITSSFLLNPSMYSSTNDSIYIYDKMTNKKDSLKMILNNDSFNVHYYSNIYNCTFSEVDFRILDKEKYINSLMYSVIDTNNIEIFNFIK